MRNIKMILEYEGTRYHGWQYQVGRITIQQVLEECIGTITQEKIRVIGSGRTDAGVHALNQVANFTTNTTIKARNLLRGINSLLPVDIAVKELMETNGAFHARHDAKSKVYLYQIVNSPVRSALYSRYAWFIREPLDLERIRETSALLIGTYDFSSFCAANCGIKNHVRTVMNIDVEMSQRGTIKVYVEADGFLKYMVRNIVGTLSDVGRGKLSPAALKGIMEAKDRRCAGVTAPACGLFLKEVRY
ncbi:MAG: tRNA pseudouridine(38-40) synthase TruA [Deltaproteobacteria bacterium]|nr:tRNA pseudouridine(38-40) synthase TruA [Deltaproteobacteria bacterium]